MSQPNGMLSQVQGLGFCPDRMDAIVNRVHSTRALCIVVQDPSWAGGICHYSHALCQGLCSAGANVTLLTAESYELEKFERDFRLVKLLHHRVTIPGSSTKGRVLRRLPHAVMFMLNARAVLQRVAALQPNVFHVQGVLNARYEPFLWRRIAAHKIPVVLTVHDVLPHEVGSIEGRSLERLYAAADHLIVHSQRARQTLVAGWHIAEKRVSIIPLGNYTFIADRWRPDPAACRQALDLPASAPVVLFFGFLREYKGLDVLIEAFARVVTRQPEIHLVIAGGHWGFRWEDTDYAALIQKHNLERQVRVRSEYIPLEKISHYFAAADVVVLPYRRGSGSAVIQLAYAFARPVIASDTGGFAETVEVGQTGMIVPPEDVEALTNALAAMTSDRGKMAAMGRAARHLAETRYSWDVIAGQTLDVYRTVLEAR